MAAPTPQEITVTFKKTGGKGTAEGSICAFDKHKNRTQLATFTVKESTQDGYMQQAKVPKDRTITMLVDGKNVLLQVAYSVLASTNTGGR